MNEASRAATADDLADIVALAEAARLEIADARGGEMITRSELAPAPTPATLRDLMTQSDAVVLVGTIDDVAVGYAIVTLEQARDGYRFAFIPEIFVLEGARGVGIGEAMLDDAFAFGRDAGCAAIESHVLPGNRHGKNFFERAAMVTRLLRVHTRLESSEGASP